MKNYCKLNLLNNPIKDPDGLLTMDITGGYNLRLPEDVLSAEAIDTFKTMGLKPTFVTLFGRNDSYGDKDTRVIHSDIKYLGGDVTDRNNWQKILFGINWELFQSHNVFSWWNMDGIEEAWPNEPLSHASKYKILNGVHFVKRGNLGIPTGATMIEETVIDGPTLVRTEIPHMTIYKNPNVKRIGISVRFDERGFKDWNDVLRFFDPYKNDL